MSWNSTRIDGLVAMELSTNTSKTEYGIALPEFCYYLFFSVMLFAKGIGLYDGQKLYTLALILGFTCWIAKIIVTRHSPVEYGIIAALFILSLAIYYHSNQIGIIIIVMTVLGMKDVPVDRVMKLGGVIWIATFSLSVIATLIGLRGDIFMAQSKLGLGLIIRWALGQPHPNVLQISYMMICAFVLYSFRCRGRKLYALMLGLTIGGLYFFLYSVSFTGIALTFIYLFLHIYLTEWRGNKSLVIFEKALIIMILPICIVFSLVGPMYFPEPLWSICNKALNTRFNIAREYMSLNPVSLFGSGYCNELPPDLNNLDCSYVFCLMHYGIIFFIIFFATYEVLVIHLLKEDKRVELSIVLALLIAGISEPFFVNPSFKNISLIFLGAYVYKLLVRLQRVRSGQESDVDDDLKNKGIFTTESLIRVAQKVRTVVLDNGRKLIISAAALGIIAGIIATLTISLPNAYYMNRSRVQIISKGEFFDINNLPEDFDGEFLEYTDAETPMIRIDGNAIKLEYVRGVISAFVWTGAVVYVAMTGVFVVRRKGDDEDKTY